MNARVTLAAADIADTTLVLPITVEGSWDGGTNWQLVSSGTWRGGQLNRNGQVSTQPPRIGYTTTGLFPTNLRAFMETPRTLSFGVEVEVV